MTPVGSIRDEGCPRITAEWSVGQYLGGVAWIVDNDT
jgi:hypothetical protein